MILAGQTNLENYNYRDLLPAIPREQENHLSRQEKRWAKKDYLMCIDRVKEDFAGFKVVSLKPEYYTHSHEAYYRRLGADYVELQMPSAAYSSRYRQAQGYYHIANQVSWGCKAVSLEEHVTGFSSKNRTRLRAKLNKSNELKLKVEEINPKNFSKWYQIYLKEIVNQPRGKAAIKEDWLTSKNLKDYRLIAYYDSSNQMIGGAIISLSKKESTAIIAYAAYSKDFREYEMPVRTFSETLKLANQHHLARLSHGWDDNMYGHHLNIGLMEFKAGLGLDPQLSKKSRIIKILNKNKFLANANGPSSANEIVCFAALNPNSSTDDLICYYFADNHRKLILPDDIQKQNISLDSIPSIAEVNYKSLCDLLKRINSASTVREILKLYNTSNYPRDHFLRLLATEENFSFKSVAVNLIDDSLRGKVESHLSLLDELEQDKILNTKTEPLNLSQLNFFKEDTCLSRFASFLGEKKISYHICKIIPQILEKLFSDTTAFEKSDEDNRTIGYRQIFDIVKTQYGERGLFDFIQELHLSINIEDFFKTYKNYQRQALKELQQDIDLNSIDYEKFFKADKIKTAQFLISRIYKNFILNDLTGYSSLNKYLTTTYGGKVTASILSFLDNPKLYIEEHSKQFGTLVSHIRDENTLCFRILEKLLKNQLDKDTNPKISNLPGLQHFGLNEMCSMLYAVGIDPNQFDFKGLTTKDMLAKIITSIDDTQIEKIVKFQKILQGDAFLNDESKDLASKIKDYQEQVGKSDIILTKSQYDEEDFIKIFKNLTVLINCSYPYRKEAFELLQKELKITLAINYEDSFLHSSETSFCLNTYIEQYKMLPEFDESSVERILSRIVKNNQDASILSKWYALNPERIPDIKQRALIARYYKGSELDSNYSWADIAMATTLCRHPDSIENGLNILRSVQQIIYSEHSMYINSIGTLLPLYRFFEQTKLTIEEKDLITKELLAILDRVSHKDDSLSKYRRHESFICIYRVFRKLDLDCDLYLEQLDKISDKMSDVVLTVLRDIQIITHKEENKDFYLKLQNIFYNAICNPHASRIGFHSAVHVKYSLSAFDWEPGLCKRPSYELVQWMIDKVKFTDDINQLMPVIGDFFNWIWTFPEQDENQQIIPNYLLQSLHLIKHINDENLKKSCLDKVKEKFLNSDIYNLDFKKVYDFFTKVNQEIDPTGEHQFLKSTIENTEFIANFNWTNCGFTEEVSERIHEFALQAECTGQVPSNLINLLYRHDSLDTFWVSQIIISTQAKSFANFIGFLSYVRCLGDECKPYINNRMIEITSDSRQIMAAHVKKGMIDKLEQKIEDYRNNGQIPPGDLTLQYEKYLSFKELYEKFANQKDSKLRTIALENLTGFLTKSSLPKLDAIEEMHKLVDHIRGGFLKFVEDNFVAGRKIRNFLENNLALLEETGILTKIVRFKSFANEEGLKVLNELLLTLADEEQTKIVTTIRPDRYNAKTTHFDMIGKFSELEKLFLESNVRDDESKKFFDIWKKLWVFLEVTDKNNTWLSVTHDLERWTKHGDDPIRTCNSIESKAGNMARNNWNYQYGISANINGRPIARMLLPQLKLAEYRQNDKVLARSVLEVTFLELPESTELHLLVEKIYSQDNFSEREEFKNSILEYALQLGINEDCVIFADQLEENGGKYPSPLPEKHRIYRDTFRPE